MAGNPHMTPTLERQTHGIPRISRLARLAKISDFGVSRRLCLGMQVAHV